MSKKIFYLLMILGLSVSLAGQVSAETSLKDTLKAKVEEQKQKLEEKRTETGQKVEEIKRKLETKRSERVKSFAKKMLNRFDLAIKRLDNLAGRISSRLDAIAKTGQDVASYKKSLDEAKLKIEGAKTALSETRASFGALSESETPKADFEAAKTKLNNVKDAINMSHAALVDVVTSIKGTATTTSSK